MFTKSNLVLAAVAGSMLIAASAGSAQALGTGGGLKGAVTYESPLTEQVRFNPCSWMLSKARWYEARGFWSKASHWRAKYNVCICNY